ncbi:hypothetical protein CALCODRAFT_486032 [Calocera cornea HHB12733]|uniref:Uncharacterized protein n=1 Tax=Calocera cornea HHB12733 TaxID=1353952 RepID=A0A165E0R4_9BASI|nr:hypothetical protein CALCODRAFT_486032 [Calocera cornea HHB12733]
MYEPENEWEVEEGRLWRGRAITSLVAAAATTISLTSFSFSSDHCSMRRSRQKSIISSEGEEPFANDMKNTRWEVQRSWGA